MVIDSKIKSLKIPLMQVKQIKVLSIILTKKIIYLNIQSYDSVSR